MNIGVYGLGRFGSFWAGLLAQQGHHVIAYSLHAHPLPSGVARGSEDAVLHQDVIFFCVAISSFESVLERVGGIIRHDAIIMDTCSVKTYPALWMQKYLPSDSYLIATHPMFGPDSGARGVKGLPVVLCPLSDVQDPRYALIRQEFESWGLKVHEMSAREHDKQAAYSQGVTHFVGRTLHEMGMHPTPIATTGYKSLMTIVEQTCNDPLVLFYDLQRYNPYAKEMRLSLQRAVEHVLNCLAETEEMI